MATEEPVTTLSDLPISVVHRIAEKIAFDWHAICAYVGFDPFAISDNLDRSAPLIEKATKALELMVYENVSVDALYKVLDKLGYAMVLRDVRRIVDRHKSNESNGLKGSNGSKGLNRPNKNGGFGLADAFRRLEGKVDDGRLSRWKRAAVYYGIDGRQVGLLSLKDVSDYFGCSVDDAVLLRQATAETLGTPVALD